MEVKSERSLLMPERFVELGGHFYVARRRYRVVRNTAVMPWEACYGCAFSGREDGKFRSCPNVKCSCFDRSDGISVWFVLDEDQD